MLCLIFKVISKVKYCFRLSRRAKRPSLGELHEGNPIKVEDNKIGFYSM